MPPAAGGPDDADDFTAVVREHGAAVFGFVFRRVRNRDLAADLTQETFLRAWRGRRGFRGDSSMRGWLCVIAANVVRDHARSARRRPAEVLSAELPDTPAGGDLADRVVGGEALTRLHDALAELPDNHREMFLLRERDGLSYREIASALGCPIGSVMSGLSRARARLLEAVDQ